MKKHGESEMPLGILKRADEVALFFETAAHCCFRNAAEHVYSNLDRWRAWMQAQGVDEKFTEEEIEEFGDAGVEDRYTIEQLAYGTPCSVARVRHDRPLGPVQQG